LAATDTEGTYPQGMHHSVPTTVLAVSCYLLQQ
jgi:hypothetical protein